MSSTRGIKGPSRSSQHLHDEIARIAEQIRGYAKSYGLDPFDTSFELIDHDELNEVAAYGGFPTRYPHWRFGMHYEELEKGYSFGLQKIYELVINNDPCTAYLMKSNSLVDQKLVIAHVYGHSDFFKNSFWFAKTNRKMLDQMANHGTRLRRYVEKFGESVVEDFLDACMSVENLIDYHSMYTPKKRKSAEPIEDLERDKEVKKIRSKEYMDRFMNPPEFVQKQRKAIEDQLARKRKLPEEPEKDVLLFLLDYAPLDNWQRDVLAIVRDEAYYFAPQALTKIMNEGWASYWHSRIMTEKVLTDAEVVDYAEHHAGTMGTQPGVLNPYKLGIELYRDIEDRWNKGRFGPDWDRCDDMQRRRNWDMKLGLGRKKIFEIRRVHNDITFIDEFLTKEFCEEQKMFTYRHNPQTNRLEIADREFEKVKEQLLFRLTNMSYPVIRVDDGNFRNRGELKLTHEHAGLDLEAREARDTLKNLFRIWRRPVHIETQSEGEGKLLSFDGERQSEETIGGE
ncbi:MAG: SpoVR family protein [Planctomycetes bacterium]|nr:SpoVR family protein [Planctomycetota bacterium]